MRKAQLSRSSFFAFTVFLSICILVPSFFPVSATSNNCSSTIYSSGFITYPVQPVPPAPDQPDPPPPVQPDPPPPDQPDHPATDYTFWSDNSYWHMKIGDNAPTHPDSDQMIAWLKSIASHNDGHPVIKYSTWTSPVYDVYENRQEVTVYNSDGTRVRYYNVPIPADAHPSEDADHLLTIIDWYKRETWDFWNLQYINGKWCAGAAYVWDLDGSGVSPDEIWTVGGAGIPLAATIIRPEEIEAGVINHPLVCALQTPKANSKVYPPAATADGKSYDTWAIPEGARIQLDPDLDLDSLGLSRTAKIIAKALQDYGMVVKESSGGFVIYAEHVFTADWTEWGLSGTLLYSLPAQWRIVDYSYFGATETYWGYP